MKEKNEIYPTKHINILFFFADDQRFDTIAALGNDQIRTPNLDELVRSGLSFTEAHIPGGSTGAVCMPSRAMLHSGRTLFHLEKHGRDIPDEHAILGEVLQRSGYRTFGTGKWHNGTSSYARSFTDGGEIYFGGMWDHWNVPACDYDSTGLYKNRARFVQNPNFDNKAVEKRCDHVTAGKHSSELFADAANDWLDRYEGDDPFFMYVSFMAPHDPRTMPDRFRDMYNPDEIRLPDNFMASHPFDYGLSVIRDEQLAPLPRTEETVHKHIAEYYGMISHLDHELGRVIDKLKQKGLYENTVIVFCADNGLAVGQHGLFGKQNLYEHSIRVPLIFSGPGIPRDTRSDAYVYLLDLFPTLCDYIGAEIPESVDGISLFPAFSDPSLEGKEDIVCRI